MLPDVGVLLVAAIFLIAAAMTLWTVTRKK
jgi:hypothetical protein